MNTTTEESQVSLKNLLEAGAHFGHRVSNWDPRMKRYIFMKRKGVHIIDLQKTVLLFDEALNYVKNVAAAGGRMLLVGTKKQASAIVAEQAKRIGEFYITTRWIGGLLTNMKTIKSSNKKLKDLREMFADPEKQTGKTKKELMKLRKIMAKMEESFGGVTEMDSPPDIIFVIDAYHEANCIREAKLVGVPICALVDTNSNPEDIDLVIPANDDAIRSIALFVESIASAFAEGKAHFKSTNTSEEMLLTEGADKPVDEVTPAKPIQEAADETVKATPSSIASFLKSNSAGLKDAPAKNSEKAKKKSTTPSAADVTSSSPTQSAPTSKAINDVKKDITSSLDNTSSTPAPSEPTPKVANSAKKVATSSPDVASPTPTELSSTSAAQKPASKEEESITTEVSAEMVKDLRERSGAKMMDCKRALVSSGGDLEKAMLALREAGMATMSKKAGRSANDGLVAIAGDTHHKAMISLACETDFVAKNENFNDLANKIATLALSEGENAKQSPEITAAIADVTTKLGEKIEPLNIEVAKSSKGVIGEYIHGNGKIGVLVTLEADDDNLEDSKTIKELCTDLCLQIAAMSPIAVTAADISNETREQEKSIFLKQLEKEGKSEAILEKIVEGKLQKHFSEVCLLEMAFVKEPKQKVSERIAEVEKELNKKIVVKNFQRLQIGNA